MTFTPEQQAWLDAHIASGEFASTDEAIAYLIDTAIADETDDLAWAKPLVDEARDAVARGEYITLEQAKAHHAELRAKLG